VCLVFTSWVQGGGFEVVLEEEGSNFLVVFLFMINDQGFAFIRLCDYCVVSVYFVLHVFAMCSCRLCVLLMLW